MTFILAKIGIFYAAVPKVACTSLKQFFFEMENGFKFRKFSANGRKRSIHYLHRSMLHEDYLTERLDGLYKVAVVREPLSRFLSAYSNRVLHHKELSMHKAGPRLQKLGLEPNPSLSLFVDRYEEYKQANNSIMHHTRPLVDFLGPDAAFFDKLYRMQELPDFEADMNVLAGTDLRIPHLQRGGPRISKDELTPEQISKIEAMFAEDYRAFGVFF